MEIALATLYVALPVIVAIYALRRLAPRTARKLADTLPGFLPFCFVLLVGAIIIVAIVLQTPPPDETDASGLVLVSAIFMTGAAAIGALLYAIVYHLVQLGMRQDRSGD